MDWMIQSLFNEWKKYTQQEENEIIVQNGKKIYRGEVLPFQNLLFVQRRNLHFLADVFDQFIHEILGNEKTTNAKKYKVKIEWIKKEMNWVITLSLMIIIPKNM